MTHPCKLCRQPVQFSFQVFCGAACSTKWESGERPSMSKYYLLGAHPDEDEIIAPCILVLEVTEELRRTLEHRRKIFNSAFAEHPELEEMVYWGDYGVWAWYDDRMEKECECTDAENISQDTYDKVVELANTLEEEKMECCKMVVMKSGVSFRGYTKITGHNVDTSQLSWDEVL